MIIKAEQSLLALGVISAIWLILNVVIYKYLNPNIQEFFRGGNIGGIIIGFLVLSGFLGILIYIVNVIRGKRKHWLLRAASCFMFLLGISIAGGFY